MYKKFLKIKDWEKTVERTATPWCVSRVLLGINKAFQDMLGCTYENRLVVFNKKNSAWYIRKKDEEEINKAVKDNIKGINFFRAEKKKYNEAFKGIYEVISILKNIDDFENLKSKEILELFREFDRTFMEYSYSGMMSIIADKILTPELQNCLEKMGYKKSKVQEIMMDLTATCKITDSFNEKIDFIQLKRLFKKNKKIDKDLVKKHWKKYCWLPVFYGDEFYKEEYFINKISEEINKDFKNKSLLKKRVKEKQEMLKKKFGSKGKNIIKLANIIKYFAHRRMIFAEAVGMANYYVLPLVAEIAKRIRVEKGEIQFFTSKEILDSCMQRKSVISKNEIIARMEKCVVAQSGKDVMILRGLFYEKMKTAVDKTDQEVNGYSLQGTGASLGKVVGSVKIVKKANELYKLKKGEIIVAPMTSVDYMIAVRKASAIITDEGGLTCHAAIVSRELRIPCIVGTKFATKLLKDGDIVEMDANKGTVILK